MKDPRRAQGNSEAPHEDKSSITPFDPTVSLLTKTSTVLTVKRKSSFWTGKINNPPQKKRKNPI